MHRTRVGALAPRVVGPLALAEPAERGARAVTPTESLIAGWTLLLVLIGGIGHLVRRGRSR
jgi:hypothetical protein